MKHLDRLAAVSTRARRRREAQTHTNARLPTPIRPLGSASSPSSQATYVGPNAREGELVFGVAHIFASFNDTFVVRTRERERERAIEARAGAIARESLRGRDGGDGGATRARATRLDRVGDAKRVRANVSSRMTSTR